MLIFIFIDYFFLSNIFTNFGLSDFLVFQWWARKSRTAETDRFDL